MRERSKTKLANDLVDATSSCLGSTPYDTEYEGWVVSVEPGGGLVLGGGRRDCCMLTKRGEKWVQSNGKVRRYGITCELTSLTK